jgi:hypothetical protein
LDGIGRTGFFTKSAEYAPGEIDPEKLRIPSACLIFGGLKGYAIYRTGNSTKITGNTTFIMIGITGEDNPSAVPWR